MTVSVAPARPASGADGEGAREYAREQLERALAAHAGRFRRIRSVTSQPSAYGSSFPVDEIDVRFEDGTTMELIAKLVDRQAMLPHAHFVKPLFVWDAEREQAIYEFILAPLDIDSARYFGSYVNGEGVRYLLLERVTGVPLWQCGDFEAWREAARCLARMHARIGLDTATHTAAAAHLLKYDRSFYNYWVERARTFNEGLHDELVSLTERHEPVIDRLLSEERAFIHGEFYASNVLVDRRERPPTFLVCPIDWEMAGLGPLVVDLACLVAGQWTDDERADIADAYFLELARLGRPTPRRSHYLKTLDCCLIHLSIRNLGWSRDWVPPPDRAYDWLGEALRLCDKWQL